MVILREGWKGELVSFAGEQVQLTNAGCTPVAPVPPRIVAAVGDSKRLIDAAVPWADDLVARVEEIAAARATAFG